MMGGEGIHEMSTLLIKPIEETAPQGERGGVSEMSAKP